MARSSRLPWVADYRDPWKEIVYNQNQRRTAWAKKRDAYLEHKAINQADGIVAVSRDVQRLIAGKCDKPKPMKVVFNGYDNRPEGMPHNECPVITYTGALSVTRIPEPLIPALVQLQKEGLRFRLRLVGNICSEFRVLIQENGLAENVEFVPYLPHAESVCRTLAQRGHRMYIVTNAVASVQQSRLRNSVFAGLFLDAFISEEAGASKPDPAYYAYVRSRVPGMDASNTLVIGDSLTTDIQGANNAGLPCCWFNPRGKERPEHLRVDYEIRDLRELLDIV